MLISVLCNYNFTGIDVIKKIYKEKPLRISVTLILLKKTNRTILYIKTKKHVWIAKEQIKKYPLMYG